MRLMTALAVLMLLAAAADAAAPAPGTTLRYKLEPGQVLVYRAVADIEAEGRGEGPRGEGGDDNRRRRNRDRERAEATSHLEMVFSYTAGEALPDGSTKLTIEVLDVTFLQELDFGDEERRIVMNADGVKIYEGKKLVQNSGWNDVNLPSGINLRALLDARIEAVITDRGEIGRFADAQLVKRLLRGANFLHLLTRQPVLPQDPITRGSSWQHATELVVANPLRLRELYRLPGTETYAAVAAVTHMNRNCLRLSIKGDWPKTEIPEHGDAKAEGSGSAIVDFATGVMFAYSGKNEHDLEGTGTRGEAEIEVESTATIQYVGGRETYERYRSPAQSVSE